MSEQHFYMTYARSRPDDIVPWVEEHDVPLLTNAIHRWSDATERLLSMWEYDTRHVIDAGGYNVMASYVTTGGDIAAGVDAGNIDDELDTHTPFYPWDVEDYHEWLCEHSEKFAWATVMDYACEERFDVLWDYQKRMEKTLETTLAQFDLLDSRNPAYKPLPVLQGREVDDYVWFYEQLEDHGIPTDHLGLGTVCRMSSEKRIASFENEIRERTGVERLHGFGVKIEAFKHGAEFESADSQAWVYKPTNGEVVIDEQERLRSVPITSCSRTRTVESFKNYYSYVTRLHQGESAVEYDPGVTVGASEDAVRDALGVSE